MIKVISTEKKPIKLWLDDIEEGALLQAKNLANLPFAFKHIAIMPDSHQGYGMPIGGILATTAEVIIPNAVGVDIGCGMCAVKTSLKEISREQIKMLFGGSKQYKGGLRSKIPVGFNHHSKKQDITLMPQDIIYCESMECIINLEFEKALFQLGTLGGGNHFIEIQKGNDGYIWVMLHSGSRNLGYKVANHYNKIAKELNRKGYTCVPPEYDLAFLPLDSEIGQSYLREMNYCVNFAFQNRKLMINRIIETFKEQFTDIAFDEVINIAHNYATIENHFGQNVMVHRKGATLARTNTIGIIPGSQGTKSYIVRGKGNPESFKSCSHGAGRVMSRTKARELLSLEVEQKKLEDKGIIHSIRYQKDLDEASAAYKDIDIVMKNQEDLVDILVELEPLAVIKG